MLKKKKLIKLLKKKSIISKLFNINIFGIIKIIKILYERKKKYWLILQSIKNLLKFSYL